MKLKRFKERDNKRIGVIVFTLVCLFLVSSAVLYRTFAIFEVKTNQNVIKGTVQGMGDLEFAFYQGDSIVKKAPEKDTGYTLNTEKSKCIDLTTNEQVSRISWDNERWGPFLSNITTTKTKCYLYFDKLYEETELNGAVPDLMNGRLVPITISDTEGPSYYTGDKGGKVYKADITKEWYKYEDKKWANAVILRDGKTDTYAPGDEIPESDIEAYFVWIPRYSYKLKTDESTLNGYNNIDKTVTNADNVSKFYETVSNQAPNNAFEITFETKDQGIQTGTTKDSSLTHPAFVSFDCNGIWVGKFETGYNQNSDNTSVMPATSQSWSTTGAEHDETNASKVIIKPAVYSWRNINVSNAFYTAYNYAREMESHMMKNMEWGAVAYLTQSKYGRCEENGSCSEVRINNSENYITGSSAQSEPTCGYTATKESCNYYETVNNLYMDGGFINNYYNKASQVSSTTGNYSGIYDMVGGAWEYVMGVMQTGESDVTPASGRNKTYNSGFKGPYSCPNCDSQTETENTNGQSWPSSKYYDKYDYKTTNTEWGRGKLGDATKEIGPFNSVSYKKPSNSQEGPVRYVGSYNADLANFVYSGYPWFRRGGFRRDGTDAGVFAFDSYYGYANSSNSFRVVLTP